MIRAIIIDDELNCIKTFQNDIKMFCPDIEVIDTCQSAKESLLSIKRNKPGLIFLDIEMPWMNGFEMLELIENPPQVIFTTAFDEFAIKAFESNAVDYLLKPFSKERFEKAIQKFRQHTPDNSTKEVVESAAASALQQNRVVVKDGSKIKIIPVNKIHYLEAADDYVKLVTSDGTFLKNRTMAFFEKSLATFHFVRVHRSYIVNSQLITRIDAYEKDNHLVLLTTGENLPVSKAGYAKLKEVLGI